MLSRRKTFPFYDLLDMIYNCSIATGEFASATGSLVTDEIQVVRKNSFDEGEPDASSVIETTLSKRKRPAIEETAPNKKGNPDSNSTPKKSGHPVADSLALLANAFSKANKTVENPIAVALQDFSVTGRSLDVKSKLIFFKYLGASDGNNAMVYNYMDFDTKCELIYEICQGHKSNHQAK